MRIGIITLRLHINYGGILQNFALQEVLKGMGHEVYTIEKEQSILLPFKKRYLVYIKRAFKRLILQQDCEIFFEKHEHERLRIISQEIRSFVEKHISIKRYKQFTDIQEDEYDAFIVGSDQIWRPKYFKDIGNAFLSFTKGWNKIRIAYAASFGTDQWEYTDKQTEHCKKLLSLFNSVSVRESQAVTLCRKYLDRTPQHVLDPTLLLSKEDYIKIITESQQKKSEGNLLVYMLDKSKEKEELVHTIAESKGLTPFTVNNPNALNSHAEPTDRIQPSMAQWLRGFYDADFVITDSFHACVFSIIFHKPFLAYGNVSRGLSRFSSLLSIFHLEHRMILSPNELSSVLNNEINWQEVETILNDARKQSLHFLKSHLR